MAKYIISISGPRDINASEIIKAVVAAINKTDPEADRYGPAIAGYKIDINIVTNT